MRSLDVGFHILSMAEAFEALVKADPELRAAMEHLRQMTASGSVDPKHMETIRKRMFLDRLTNGAMGNFAAFEDEQESPDFHTNWVHFFMDGNDHKWVNDNLGYEEGNNAIRNYANSIRDAVHTTVGEKNAKVHRLGGDEFHVMVRRTGDNVKDHQTAAYLARDITKRVDALAPLQGQFKHSLKIGMGHTYAQAEEAQREAKKVKNAQNYPKGQSRTHVHSLIPGQEGAVPLNAPDQFDIAP